MIMHPSWSWRLGEHLPTQQLGIGAHSIYELTVGSSSISGYDGFVLFCLSEHLQPVRERGSMEKGAKAPSEGHNAPARYFFFTLLLRFLTEGSTGGPLPPTTRSTSELFSYHLSSDKLLRANLFPSTERGVFLLQLFARALSLSCLSLSLISSRVCVCVCAARASLLDRHVSVLAFQLVRIGVFVRVRFFFFFPVWSSRWGAFESV